MKKIIFCAISLSRSFEASFYKPVGIKDIEDKTPVHLPAVELFDTIIQPDDKVKIVYIQTKEACHKDSDRILAENTQKILADIDYKKAHLHADITAVPVLAAYEETKDAQEKLFQDLIEQIEDGAELYADVTYGPRPLLAIEMSVLLFAEKYFHGDIRKIVYGKMTHPCDERGNADRENSVSELFDITPLYYLSNLLNTMNCETGEQAREAVKHFFAL